MFNPATIAVQMYSVRDALQWNYEGVVRQIAAMGYNGVETAGMFGGNLQKAKALFNELGLAVPSAHSGMPIGDKANEVLDTAQALGVKYLICPWLPPDDYFKDMDGVKRACDMLNQANSAARSRGLAFGYHNHWFEMNIIDGDPVYRHMLKLLDKSIVFELDTYWVKVGGQDPVQVMAEMDGRVPLLHMKDGPANAIEPSMVAVGSGKMDVKAILQASQAEWHIVELDRCDTDMLTAVRESYDYLKSAG